MQEKQSRLSRLPESAQPSRLSSSLLGRLTVKLPNRPNLISSNDMADLDDWRTPILQYLHDPNTEVDRRVGWSAEFVLHHELYRKIIKDLLLRCLGSDQAKMVMGKFYGL